MENSGAVYIFRRGDEGWRQEAYVKASNTGEPEDGDNFGYALGLSADGNTLAVGATSEDGSSAGVNGDDSDNTARGAGAVYVFARENGKLVSTGLSEGVQYRSDRPVRNIPRDQR